MKDILVVGRLKEGKFEKFMGFMQSDAGMAERKKVADVTKTLGAVSPDKKAVMFKIVVFVPMFSPLEVISRHFAPNHRILHPKMTPGTSSEVCRNDFYVTNVKNNVIIRWLFNQILGLSTCLNRKTS